MRKYLITLDVNGTLLDTKYRSTSPTINSVIDQLEDEGHTFLLNSNRSQEDLMHVAKIFSLRGPMIAENGCFIYNQETGAVNDLVSLETKEQLQKVQHLIHCIIEKHYPDALFFEGDTTDINKHIDVQEIPQDKKYVFIMNEFRRFTISIHVKRIEDNKFVADLDKAKEFHEHVKKEIFENNLKFKSEYTKPFANLLVCPTEYNKVAAFRELARQYPKHIKVVITDDAMDNPMRSEIDYLFVVGNASIEAKEVADFIAREEITKGVEEILLKIDGLVK
ncbi:HAD family phosphatase [Candidatus Falkowbacteria bacterium]|jgi:HAD superfamily hydrolase (TIGR01484 family)|nr:HAD family phosphatase [Candidatus Falkowbacteria bacterium]MBT5502765.1 HAD family phosphatase [Candidatus Falkowbacteria bacterium]MBT6573452.1 HAD family phosphatase [Candidatus Falkowbacteria bacterium]MBT7348291.1 HAD family phosphatase [Candidatus Falkowbacteria bacterium]MBT7501163.1 HAD family phosphatase [Candidatus Falkowbacteria bacterium]